ncbi:MAG TPA: hypothetical protein VF546_22915 [Pyrinomonadaceae bacterium]|jgi:hypothetical protein
MYRHTRPAVLLFCLSLCAPLCAQTPTPTAAKTKTKPPAPARAAAAADPLAETRRTTAIALVTSLADEARGFHDEALRARVQARAADALWDVERERARNLFRRAWDAAEVADRESERKEEEERQRQMSEKGAVVLSGSPRLRAEVLRLAAKRDRALGEELLAKLDETKKQQDETARAETAANAGQPKPRRTNELTPVEAQRLDLARQLLASGDVERAKQFALPALERVTTQALKFLVALRAAAPTDADAVFRGLLLRAANDPEADANTISYFSSYLFSPSIFITAERGGGWGSESWTPPAAAAEVPADLRAAFFGVAAQVLLRPLPPPEQDQTTAGRGGTYFVIARLLPLFEQHAPERAPLLRTQLAALTPDAPEPWRTGRDPMLTEGLRPADEPARDMVQDALDRLPRVQTTDERDQIYVQAAFTAARKGDAARARSFADKIEDPDVRRQLRAHLDFETLRHASEKKDTDEMLRLAKDGDLTPLQRVYGYTDAARLLMQKDRVRALEALDDAGAVVRRMDGQDPDRARALLAVLSRTFELDRGRVWELLPELVKTVNALSDFSGEDGRIVSQFRGKGFGSVSSTTSDSFDLTDIFTQLARADMERAVELARSFNGESPRAVATLAVARAVLTK